MSFMTYKWQLLDMIATDLFSSPEYAVVKEGQFQSPSVGKSQQIALYKVKSASSEWGNWIIDRHPIDLENSYICRSLKQTIY